jgi:hypothetical protein
MVKRMFDSVDKAFEAAEIACQATIHPQRPSKPLPASQPETRYFHRGLARNNPYG